MINLREPNEDLFETSRMTFGEHLEELRVVLVRAMMGVAVGCIFGFLWADQVVNLLTEPLADAISEFERTAAERSLTSDLGYVPPSYVPLMDDGFNPRAAYVDPAELVRGLQTVVPAFGQEIELDTYGFRADHFVVDELPSLAERLLEAQAEEPIQQQRLTAVGEMLEPGERAMLERLKANSEPQAADLVPVLAMFNRLLRMPEVAELPEFSEVVTIREASWTDWISPPTPRPLADLKATLDDPETPATDKTDIQRQLNRALLSSMFPGQVNAARLEIVPLMIWEQTAFRPQALGVTESFFVWLKAGLFSGLTLSAPWVFYQLWSFVAAGLYPHEKKYIHIFLPISLLLFVFGVLLAFFFVFQPVLGFLFSFNQSLGIAPQMRIGEWMGFAMFLPLGFGIAFQLPLVMLFINRIGLVSVEAYLSKWRVAVMVIFVLAMFLTPADPISMLLLAVPLTGLYFLGIGMCKWMPKQQNPFGEDAQRVS